MGGNALKNTYTRRYDRDEYKQLESSVLIRLLSDIRIDKVRLIPAYHNKESFGDMDVLVSYAEKINIIDIVKEIFNPNEIVKNDTVVSFDYKEFQIDLIRVPAEVSDYAHAYFGYNDLGNLIGKLCHKFGLKHGHTGLYLPLRDGDNMFAEILINSDHRKTLKFLGLDCERFDLGFDDLDSIFNYVSSSKYFNPDFYQLENLNNIARTRDRKRETYNKFLKFCDTYTGPKWTTFSHDKSDYLQMIFDAFPEAYPVVQEKVMQLSAKKHMRTKFNGEIVSMLTGLKAKELGMFMKHLKTLWNFSDTILMYLDDAVIQQNIIKEHLNYVPK